MYKRQEEDKADKGRGGKTTSGDGQAWSSAGPRGQWRTGKMEKTGYEIISGAPTTLAVKGLMMMMMNVRGINVDIVPYYIYCIILCCSHCMVFAQ